MKKLDLKEICANYNRARIQNGSREFTNNQLQKELISYGISQSSAIKLIRNNSFFKSYSVQGQGKGKHIRYKFLPESVHISLFEKAFYGKKEKADIPFEEECINYLKGLGYKVFKPEGFDLNSFKKENPALFEKYSICKEI